MLSDPPLLPITASPDLDLGVGIGQAGDGDESAAGKIAEYLPTNLVSRSP
jgi:hypothetical protein